MTVNDDFKKAIIEGKLNEALAIAVSKAPELKITTTITPSQYTELNTNSASDNESIKRLHTRINLVEGEVYNEISEELIGNVLYEEIQQFHFEQVARGHQTIQKNLESLQSMFGLMTALQKQQLQGEYADINYLDTKTAPLLSEQTSVPNESATESSVTQQNLLSTSTNNEFESPPTLIQANGNQQDSNLAMSSESITQEKEDWGEWLEEEEESDIELDLLDLSSLDLDESEDWEDWEGEETQLFAGTSAQLSEENKDS